MTGPEGGGFHPVNVLHLVLGVAFLGYASVWALRAAGVVDHDDLHWLLPVPWVLAGVLGLAAATLGGRQRARTDREGLSDGPRTPTDPEEQR